MLVALPGLLAGAVVAAAAPGLSDVVVDAPVPDEVPPSLPEPAVLDPSPDEPDVVDAAAESDLVDPPPVPEPLRLSVL